MQIFVTRNGQQLGPYDEAAVRAGLQDGTLRPEELAWFEGAPGWMPLSAVPGLMASTPPVPYPAAQAFSAPPARRQGKGALFWVLGGCGGLVLLTILGVVGLGMYGATHRQAAALAVAPTRTGEWKTFVAVKETLPPDGQAQFVPFSFDYPASYKIHSPFHEDIVMVERISRKNSGFSEVNMSIGTFSVDHPEGDNDKDIYPGIIDQVRGSFSQLPRYREFASLHETVDGVSGKTLLFQGELDGQFSSHKVIVLRRPGEKNGLLIILAADAEGTEIKTPFDLGKEGDTAEMLRSFRWR